MHDQETRLGDAVAAEGATAPPAVFTAPHDGELGFPIDRTLPPGVSTPATVSISAPFDAALLGVGPLGDVVAFSALFVFGRMLGATAASARRPLPGALAEASIVQAAFLADMPLHQAFATLRRDLSAPPVPLALEVVGPDARARGAELVLAYRPEPGSVRLFLTFDAARMTPVSATDFLEKIALAARALATTPDLPCGALELVTPTARARLPDLSRPIAPRRYDPVPATFLSQARRHAERTAIAAAQGIYSYADLSRLVRHLAARLIDAGVTPGDVVAVSGSMSFGMVAAMIAAMAAGGVMVTIDQALPEERRKLIADISRPRFQIDVRTAEQAKHHDAGAIVTVDWPSVADIAALPETDPAVPQLGPDAPAYIFFTSGSTGVPKGVLGAHLGLAHFLDWQRAEFPIGPGDRAAQITALSFDVVLRDVLFPLTNGACLCIPERGMLLDARRMLRWFSEHAITVTHCVPSLMKAWLHGANGGSPFASLKTVFFAGEPLTDTLLDRFVRTASVETCVVNLYGPTETTLAKLAHVVREIEPGVQPVGRPQPGVDVAIIRDRRFLCGLWETGEIVLRTPYRSKGYLGNAELTQKAFQRNPFSDDPDDLVYFTGDLGRVRANGEIEIFGRTDAQIKIRGVRIEPSEVEGEILKLPGVRDAAVTVRIGANEEKSLVAVVAPERPIEAGRQEAVVAAEIRDALRARLLDAMVPSAVIFADQLPYLPNGKIDRVALRRLAERGMSQPREEEEAAATEAPAPSNDVEERLLKAWGDQFRPRRVTPDSSFASLAGDSLSYVFAYMALEDILGEAPSGWQQMTIAELAARKKAKVSRFWTWVEPSLAIRAVAIVIIVAAHLELFTYGGGSTDMLLVVAGYLFGTLQLPEVIAKHSIAPVLRMIKGLVLPYYLLLVPLDWFTLNPETPRWPLAFMLADAIPQNSSLLEGTAYLWFVDVVVHIAVIFSLTYLAIRVVVPRMQSVPVAVAACIAVGVVGRYLVPLVFQPEFFTTKDPSYIFYFAPTSYLATFMLVAAAAMCRGWRRLALILLLVGYAAVGAKAYGYTAALMLMLAVALMFYVPKIPIPRILAPVVYATASASLFIYFFHYHVEILFEALGLASRPLILVAAIAVGIGVWRLWNWGLGKILSIPRAEVAWI